MQGSLILRHPAVPDVPLLHITVAADADSVRQTLQSLAEDPLFGAMPNDLRSSAVIVLAEVMNNIVEHGYAARSGDMTLTLHHQCGGLRCQILDRGCPMPGLCLPPGLQQPVDLLEDIPEGGYGWFLIRSLTKDLAYHRINGTNHLSFLIIDGV